MDFDAWFKKLREGTVGEYSPNAEEALRPLFDSKDAPKNVVGIVEGRPVYEMPDGQLTMGDSDDYFHFKEDGRLSIDQMFAETEGSWDSRDTDSPAFMPRDEPTYNEFFGSAVMQLVLGDDTKIHIVPKTPGLERILEAGQKFGLIHFHKHLKLNAYVVRANL